MQIDLLWMVEKEIFMKYLYTVIIPHHNIPQLLRRCLLTIPCRDDVQVVVVDDRSDSCHIPVLRQIECDFPWVLFIYLRDGGGAGKARNVGLSYAKGKYVLFADADDFFMPCLGHVFDDYARCEQDIVFFNANSLDTDTYLAAYRCLHLNGMMRKYDKRPDKAVFEMRYAFGEPWCKMVRREVIEKNNIRFSETIIHNDTRFSYLVGHYAQSVLVDRRAIYCVTDRAGSVSKRISMERLFVRTEVFAEANKFFKDHGIKRFDGRGLRPLMRFVVKMDIPHIKKCVSIMEDNGMTAFSIFIRCLCFPFSQMSNSGIVFKRLVSKLI